MSFEITTAFVKQFTANMIQVAQQKGSRLRKAVAVDPAVGEDQFFDFVGTVTAQRINDRHGDSPLNSTPLSRRKLTLFGYDTGDLIDKLDKVALLSDPTSAFVQAHAAAMGRAMDDEIIAAAFATAKAGKEGTVDVAFPAGNVIAVDDWEFKAPGSTLSGNSGLTVAKLIKASMLLSASEAAEADVPKYIVCTARQVANLLTDPQVTSADYNTVQALVSGKIDSYLGFEFIRTERVQLDGSGHRRVIACTQNGIGLGISQDIMGEIAPRPDKRFSTYVYFSMQIGATRRQETDVFEIKCDEP